ncbi:MAG: tryptophan synthase subunit alpha [Deltaproteobacteria bacterium]|nr:tryptophan synthase subunit alpha [Deltaproteobacteria bacterium]
MSRIITLFENLRKKKEKALGCFITAGDPDLSTTHQLVLEMEKSGADFIELGIPFSDPMADGPVIQKSSERALLQKTYLPQIFKLVLDLRKKTEIPIVLMGYYNPILQYGCESFCKESKRVGVDALIVVDLPPEESDELDLYAKRYGIHLIYLLTPTSNAARIAKVKKKASGFIYYVSMTGITGSQLSSLKSIQKQVQAIQSKIELPVCVGFGIQNPTQAKAISALADGIVVGSALVQLIEQSPKGKLMSEMRKKVTSLKKSLN